MKITEIHIKGFRSLGEVTASIANYSSLIGRNDSGKSSFLHALLLLFDKDREPSDSDICKVNEYSGDIFVQATLCECTGHEDMAVDNQIVIRRSHINGKWLREVKQQIPRDETLKKIHAGTLNRGEWNSAYSSLPEDIAAQVNERLAALSPSGRILPSIWTQVFAEIKENESIEWEIGWSPIDTERLGSLVTVVMLDADTRGEEELAEGGKSIFNRVGGLLLREATNGQPEVAQAIQQLSDAIQKVATSDEEGKWPVQELNRFQQVMEEEIGRFDGDVSATSTIAPPKIPALEFSVKVNVSDRWIKGIDKMGHGLRRSVVFAMLRTHQRLRTESNNGRNFESSSPAPLYLFLIEEPELYLHPQAERRRMEELQELAGIENTQVMLCTHSAIFVDIREYHGILRFDRQERGMTQVHSWTGDELDADYEKLLKMAYQFNENRASMLFAKHVVLTEGQTEKIMLPLLAKTLGCYDPDVEVVDCGGNQGMPALQRILEGFGIRYVAWMDRDDNAPSRNKTNISSLEAIGKVRNAMTSALGRMIILKDNWEDLADVPSGDKPYNSWKYFVEEASPVNALCEAKIRSAFDWETHEDL